MNQANEKHVSYQTPVGCFSNWESAAIACERADLDPCTCIAAVVSPTDVISELAYGTRVRLSNAVRVF